MNFVSNTLPKPVLFALVYRLLVLHLASRILPNIGADSWEDEGDVDGRPVSNSRRDIVENTEPFPRRQS